MVTACVLAAAAPPALINYQGVLRNAAGVPLNGSQDMVFTFYSDASGGDQIMTDSHSAAYGNAVAVSNGLFTTQFGGGTLADGSGSGYYANMADVFRDYSTVYVSILVEGETLNPRVRVVSSAYALNADHLDGLDSSSFLTYESDPEVGTLTAAKWCTSDGAVVNCSSDPPIMTDADTVDGQHADYFINTSSAAQTKTGLLSINNSAAFGYGLAVQADFCGASIYSTGYLAGADIGFGTAGMDVYGRLYAGLFQDTDSSSKAYLAYGDVGLTAEGTSYGGSFYDSDSFSQAFAGYGDYGLWSEGAWGISATGSTAGGVFADDNGTGAASIAVGDTGIEAHGNYAGGYLYDSNGSGQAYLGFGDISVYGSGNSAGAYFADSNSSGYASIATGDWGLGAYGNSAGGSFEDLDSGNYLYAGFSTYKAYGTGTNAFVQNHPMEKDRVIVYASPEGDEVATYTRGTARLVHGEARVHLGDTFRWVTNPDIGLTAHLTPKEDCSGLYVAYLSTSEMVVRELNGGLSDVAFDYLVYGLRIGFEEISIVQEKMQESWIPSFNDHRERYMNHPDLRGYNALERFKGMETTAGMRSSFDFTAANALRDAIHEYDPAVNPHPQRPEETERAQRPLTDLQLPIAATAQARRPAAALAPGADPVAPVEHGTASSSASPVTVLKADRFPVVDSVTAGDVLVMIPDNGDKLHPCSFPADPMVAGVAVTDAQDGYASVTGSGYLIVKADATTTPIAKGDLLTASPLAGHAMKAPKPAEQGTVIGKALEPLQVGTGLIKVLVMLR